MLVSRSARVISRGLAAALVTAGALIAVQGGASASVIWTSVPPTGPGDENLLFSVTALSPSNAWAAGWYTDDDAVFGLIEHWNGASWKQVPSPNPGGDVETDILGIRAASATDIWAVGTYLVSDGAYRTLILHWDGTSWKQVPSPNPAGTRSGDDNSLAAVTASSPTSAWAVGQYGGPRRVSKTLVLHWNGTRWKRVASPSPGSASNDLSGVAASSARAWAVGAYASGGREKTLILHWNGTAWKHVPSPSPASSGSSLMTVRSSSSSNAWAVGSYSPGGRDRTLALHWNGTRWKRVATPDPGGSGGQNELSGLAVFSSANAWATGSYRTGTTFRTLILHWNGTAWKHVASPNPGGGGMLSGAGASSSGSIWTVGRGGPGDRQAIALHCC
jgi:hypothetical protein